jgi:hypothetical protein
MASIFAKLEQEDPYFYATVSDRKQRVQLPPKSKDVGMTQGEIAKAMRDGRANPCSVEELGARARLYLMRQQDGSTIRYWLSDRLPSDNERKYQHKREMHDAPSHLQPMYIEINDDYAAFFLWSKITRDISGSAWVRKVGENG